MKRLPALLLAALCLASAVFAAAPPAKSRKPKLVLMIVLDQFRYDYTTRYRSDYTGGFDKLLTSGAVFTNARYDHFPTVTAVGHSTVLTGAIPSLSGIIANEWFDRDVAKVVTSVSDPETKLLGGGKAGATGSSPRRLLVDTLGDELKMAGGNKPRVIGMSLKDRAAILPAGHLADAAYWFDPESGTFASSTYYFPDLPGWVKDFNGSHPVERYRGAKWLNHQLPDKDKELYGAVEASPFGNDLLERFAERALDAEQLGQRGVTDLLSISFSVHDYVGHGFGPFSPEEREVSIQTDKLLQKLFELVDKRVGLSNAVIILTADHGVAPSPGTEEFKKMPGGRMPPLSVMETVQKALTARYGDAKWVASSSDLQLFLNPETIAKRGADPAEVRRQGAAAVAAMPHIFRVFTRDQILKGELLRDPVGQRIVNGYNERRGADLEFVPDPYWILATAGTTHGGPFGYDNHVPIIFMGPGIKPGRYHAPVIVNDIAPTLATMLDVETPSGAVGRVLQEMLQ